MSPAQREPEMAGETVVLIGGSAGIGLETARRAPGFLVGIATDLLVVYGGG